MYFFVDKVTNDYFSSVFN